MMGRLINRIVDQCLQHAMTMFDEARKFAIQPAEHECLRRCRLHLHASLAGGAITNRAEQCVCISSIFVVPPGAEINFIIVAMNIHFCHWIQRVPHTLKPGYCVAAMIGRSVVMRCSTGMIGPPQIFVSKNYAFTKTNSEVKNDVESTPLACPRFQKSVEYLTCFVVAKIGNKRATVSTAPSRNHG